MQWTRDKIRTEEDIEQIIKEHESMRRALLERSNKNRGVKYNDFRWIIQSKGWKMHEGSTRYFVDFETPYPKEMKMKDLMKELKNTANDIMKTQSETSYNRFHGIQVKVPRGASVWCVTAYYEDEW